MKRRVLAALLFVPLLLAGAEDASARPRSPVQVELRPYVGELKTIDVVIAGRQARLLFDTGAGLTAITPQFARSIGCEPWGQLAGFRMNGERVDFQRCGRIALQMGAFSVQRELSVFDLASLLPAGLPPIDGVAGLDLFENETVTLTRGLAALRIESARSQRRATSGLRGGRIRLSREAGGAGLTVFAPARSPRGDLWLLVDSGNLAGLRLSPASVEALGGGETLTVAVEGAPAVAIEPEIVAELIYDGALNAAFIGAHDVTLDLANQRGWWRGD
jgi:hypothetical protein